VKPKSARPACGCRLHLTGYQVEALLRRHRSLPKRRSDLSIVGDLARLEWQLIVLRNAMGALLHGGTRKKHEFDIQLAYLVAAVDGMKHVCADLDGPLGRVLKRRAGAAGELLATTRALADLTAGFTKQARKERAD
jgi:hypothetical protein